MLKLKKLIDFIKNLFPKTKKKYKFKPKGSCVNYVMFSDNRISVDLKRYFKSEHGKKALENFRKKK